MNENSHENSEDSEENYFVSLSDLMTGVVFIFVILLCAFAFHYQNEAQAVRDAIAAAKDLSIENDKITQIAKENRRKAEEIQNSESEMTEKANELKKLAENAQEDARKKGEKIDAISQLLRDRDESLKKNLSGLVAKLSDRGVRVLFDPSNGVIRLPEELLFARGNDMLSKKGERGLKVIAEELLPVLKTGCTDGSSFRLESVFIEGHTDSDPIRSSRFSDNWDLSAARATNTYRALIQAKPELELFVNPSKLRVLGVSGYGENRPVAPNDTDDNKKSNRRVDLRFLMAYPTDAELDRMRREIDEENELRK
jgi:chemotaxis protein MotB